MEHRSVLIQISCKDESEAVSLMSYLVEDRAAACVQKQEIHSVYRWEGRVDDAKEYLLNIKTVPSKIEEIRGIARSVLSTEVFELIVLPIVGGNEEYLQWIEKETS